MIFRRRQSEQPRIDLTSLVDVVFLLLIFFMVSTSFIESPGLDIRLPESSSQRQTSEAKEVRVVITQQGELFVDQQPFSLTELSGYLKQQKTAAGDARFVLLADTATQHGRVVEVMDLARQNGYTSLAISTRASAPKDNP